MNGLRHFTGRAAPARRWPVRPGLVDRPLLALIGVVAAITALAVAHALRPVPHGTISGPARVIDGDSLSVGGVEVRLFGIDAPELFQRCTRDGRELPCGREAARQLAALIAGQTVACERRDIDRFGRTVAVCRAAGVDLGRAMVAGGHAVAYGAYAQEEAGARLERRGLWAGEFAAPRLWREQQRRQPAGP